MGAKKFDYDLEELFYGDLCQVESVDEQAIRKREENPAYNVVHLPLSKTANGFVSPVTELNSRSTPLGSASVPQSVVFFPFLFNNQVRSKLKLAVKELGLTQEKAAKLIGVSHRSLVDYLDEAIPKGQNLMQIQLFMGLYSLLKSNIDLSYALKKVLNTEHEVFANKTAVEYAYEEKENGILSVLGVFRRIYE